MGTAPCAAVERGEDAVLEVDAGVLDVVIAFRARGVVQEIMAERGEDAVPDVDVEEVLLEVVAEVVRERPRGRLGARCTSCHGLSRGARRYAEARGPWPFPVRARLPANTPSVIKQQCF